LGVRVCVGATAFLFENNIFGACASGMSLEGGSKSVLQGNIVKYCCALPLLPDRLEPAVEVHEGATAYLTHNQITDNAGHGIGLIKEINVNKLQSLIPLTPTLLKMVDNEISRNLSCIEESCKNTDSQPCEVLVNDTFASLLM